MRLFLFEGGCLRDIKRLSLIFKQNSELLEAINLKLSKETTLLRISMWYLTAVRFFYLDHLFVKVKTHRP